MDHITISDIFIYPVKSTGGLLCKTATVYKEGLAYDRRWAIVDAEMNILTAREHPELFAIQTSFTKSTLDIHIPGSAPVAVPLRPDVKNLIAVKIFDTPVSGNHVSLTADKLMSDYLGVPCQLIFMDEDCERIMKPIYGGGPEDKVSYADSAPIMLVSDGSLQELNSRLAFRIGMQNFRPNIVVSGCNAYEEDGWKVIKIGEVVFDINEKCRRCVMTTIDPDTGLRNNDQEPLRTLATYKRHSRGGVSFGVTLIPRNTGTIRQGDHIEIVEQKKEQTIGATVNP